MSDGVNLSTDVYLPKSDGPFPALLVRTIYDNQSPQLVPVHTTKCIEDRSKEYEPDVEFIELVIPSEYSTKAFHSTEQTLHLIAPLVQLLIILPSHLMTLARRNDN